jgi:hypothetical protein
VAKPTPPGEFEAYATRSAYQGQQDLRRFGADLVTEPIGFGGAEGLSLVPPDYVLAPGDEVQIVLWGSVDADMRLPVDRTGRINMPRIGAIMVAGTRYGELPKVIEQRVAQVFRNFQLNTFNGTSFVVFRQSKHKAAAWKLIEYLSLPQTQAKFHALTGDLPPRRSPWRTPALANDAYAKAYREQLERAIPTPKVPEWERIAQEMRVIGEEVANDRMSVDEAAAELDRRADRFLEKRRWMLDQAAKAGVP